MADLLPQPADLLPLLPGAAVGGIAIGMAAWLRSVRGAAALGALGVAAALVVTWLQIHGSLPLDPVQSSERALWSGLGWAMVTIVALALLPPPRAPAGTPVLLAVTAAGAVCWIVSPFLGRPPDDPSGLSWTLALALGGGAALLALLATAANRDAAPARPPTPALAPVTAALAVGTAGQVLFLFGSASLAQLCGGLALAGGLGAMLTLARRRVADATLIALLGCGAFLAIDGLVFLDDTPSRASLGLLAVVALTPWLTHLAAVRRLPPWAQTLGVLGLAFALAGAAVGLAIREMPAPDPYADAYR